jgi:carboxyl-terminal processing protease
VISDIVVPGPLSETDIGEKFAKHPLDNDSIKPNFEDDLSDIPYIQRDKVANVYKFDLQRKIDLYSSYTEQLKKNSEERIKNNKNFQNFLKEIKKKDFTEEETEQFGQNDLQLLETYSIMKDLIMLMMEHFSYGEQKTLKS